MQPVTTATVGLGGYARAYLRILQENHDSANPTVRFVAACSSNPSKHPETVAALTARGVKMAASFEDILKEPVEAVWLPLPIDLHRSYTEQALATGKAVMCEKPVAGCVDDVDAMIAARDRAKLPVAIGYQDVYDTATVPTKRAILDGRIGKVQDATVWACWPRDSNYYARAGWAGALQRGGVWVMDSPANNALAHYINITLFLLGATMETAATPIAIDAEMYRVNPIENFDTCAFRLQLPGGVRFQVMFTHACEETFHPVVEIHGSKGMIRRSNEQVEIVSGSEREVLKRDGQALTNMVRRFSKLVRGEPDDKIAVCSLEAARAQSVTINGAAEARAVTDVPSAAIKVLIRENPDVPKATLRAIDGIENAFRQCIEKRQLLHESGLFRWTEPAGTMNLAGYHHFKGPKMK